MSYVICIAGTSGAGKTTLTRAMARRCGNALIVSFDDYAYAPPSVLPDSRRWIAEGADPAAWRVPNLTRDLLELRQGRRIRHPVTKLVTIPRPIIVVEEPFWRSRPELGTLIDFVAVLDTPLEVALARRLLRELRSSENSEPGRLSSRHVKFLEEYLEKGVRNLYVAVQRLALKQADYVLDGLLAPNDMADKIVPLLPAVLEIDEFPGLFFRSGAACC
jgi:uridine kinase